MLVPLFPTFVLALQPSTLSPVLSPTATLLSARTAGIGMGTQLSQDLEKDRPNRRTVFMHKEWVNHRDSDRTWKNMKTLYDSSVFKAVSKEVTLITSMAVFVVVLNMIVVGYQDFGGVYHESDLILPAGTYHPRASIPAQPFTIAMPALSLLLVFRTNTGYARWNEARTLWGGVINNCRNIARQANSMYPQDENGKKMRSKLTANTAVFAKALRNFLRGADDDATFRAEMMQLVEQGLMSESQVEATMAAKNRPMFCLSAMSANLRRSGIDPNEKVRIDKTIGTLVDLTGACERIFKSPIPLVYTRHASRFLTSFLLLMPFALWESAGSYWNHWITIPEAYALSFFLFGIEEIGIQTEEPFGILPIEAFCDAAIAATMNEMNTATDTDAFDFDADYDAIEAVEAVEAVKPVEPVAADKLEGKVKPSKTAAFFESLRK
jgi:predicted membrane chloride channel (bestrophin family)